MGQWKDEEFIRKFGEYVFQLRKERGLSQSDLAGMSNLDKRQIRRIEKGEANSTLSTVKRVADALEINVRDLFGFEIPEESPD
jgi:transcriptional regulator with XRE-family HTH domain